MATPTFPSEGSGAKTDALVNDSAYASFKRGYVRETPAGSTVDAQHAGVIVGPSSVTAAASTSTPAQITASLPTVSVGKNYLTGFLVSGGGANAQSVVHVTISGLPSAFGFDLAVPSGVTLGTTTGFVNFPNPIPASTPSTAITITVPSFGTGNTLASVAIWGFKSE